MTRYLVTFSNAYYPGEGTSDWIRLFDSQSDAVAFAKGVAAAKDSSGTVYVICIDFEESTFAEIYHEKTAY